MEIWYVEERIQPQMTFYIYTCYMFFDSESAMQKWIDEYEYKESNLRCITAHGKAEFNENGVLVPKTKMK